VTGSQQLSFFIEAAAFLAGLIFGSFLNVCIARIPRGESIVTPRSRCLGCGHAVRWYDNFPLLSWLALRARCRDCKATISWRYPAVELATAIWFAIAAYRVASMLASPSSAPPYSVEEWMISAIASVSLAVLGFLLIGLMVMDWQTYLLPDAFTFGGMAAALFLVCCQAIFLGPGEDQIVMNSNRQLRLRSPGSFAAQGNVFITGPEHLIFGRVAAVCGVALLLLAIRWIYKALRHRDGMGLGDVKMLAMIAAFLGFWPAILALFCGVLTAAIISVALLTKGRATAATRIPFGSFLAIGGLIAAVFGDRIIAAYTLLLQ
jgi:leader peptidase (prepilin peptidase)/N-methyltransferase